MTIMTFEQAFNKHKRWVFNYLKKYVKDPLIAEDLQSEVMMKVYQKWSTFDESKAQLSTWIGSIAKNHVIDYLRKRKVSTVSLDQVYIEWANGEEVAQTDHLIALQDSALNPEERMIRDEVSAAMYKKFETLSESEKLIASLHYFDGLSYDEVAEQLNMPLGTVKAKLHRARMTMMESVSPELRK